MSRREDIYDDDQVEVMLDTFHDRRRAYAFQTTPLGVQWDAIWTEATREEVNGNFDTSFDTVWDSRGKVTDRGFVVWMAIPFKSLRFPATQTAGVGNHSVSRNFSQKRRFILAADFLQSSGPAGAGGDAVWAGGNFAWAQHRTDSLRNHARLSRRWTQRDPYNPYFQNAEAQGQFGMDAKFVIHDHFVLDLTANPDFSQVESEDPQITVNQRFEVYFPEKRPFFLENEDYFRTPLDLFFTRNIRRPFGGNPADR